MECETLDREFSQLGRPELNQSFALPLVELTTAGWQRDLAAMKCRRCRCRSAEELIRRVELYFNGGAIDYLTKEQVAVVVDLGVR